jgi:membrane-associated phospholipid phosphatase
LLRPAIVFVVAAVAFAWLGTAVSHRPPSGIDLAGLALGGRATHVALVFTASCWWAVLVPLGVAALVLAARVPAWRARALFSVAIALAGWIASDRLKDLFARARPEHWYLHHETSYSYPSGHAMFAVLVYGLWAFYVARSSLPLRGVLATLLALWGAGVIWSRLALGAHYVTDLIGGVLLATALLAVGRIVVLLVAPGTTATAA